MLYTLTQPIVAVNEGEDIPEVLADPIDGEDAFKLNYISTDAWRGYWEAEALEDSGWVKADDGWMTGEWDDAPVEARSSSVEAKLTALAEDQDVVAIFMPTSNVFSTSYDVFVRAGE